MRRLIGILAVLAVMALASSAQANYIAYEIPDGTVGTNPNDNLALGLEFDVVSAITVTKLGVFDSKDDFGSGQEYGLRRTITAIMYDRDTQAALATLVFTPADSGARTNGSWFKTLTTPLQLAAGFHGMIVAENYGNDAEGWEPYAGSATPSWTTNDGGGLITFLQDGKYAAEGSYPNLSLGYGAVIAPVAAGTFEYVPEPASAVLLLSGGVLVMFRRRKK